MDFKQILLQLKNTNRFNRSALAKEIVMNIGQVNRTELLDIMELMNSTTDNEYQVKLMAILTAYLIFNNSCRDVIIKSIPLYNIIQSILARGLPIKAATTLNFVTSLLYTEDDGGSRGRTLTLHAQNLIRSSGCLTAMIHLFTSYMLPTETWQALCRCLAEVCRGSELNQNSCSHLVPLCIQRCLRDNQDVLPVLQSLLSNNKRNTNLFLDTDGPSIFNRKDYLRLEACLQLLHTVIQNAEVDAISTMIKCSKVYENLQDILKTNNAKLSTIQWSTIVLYHLDSKLKKDDKCFITKTSLKQHLDSNDNDTQVLLQNIMSEVLSCPSITRGHIPLKHSSKVADKLSNLCDISRVMEGRKPNHNECDKEKKVDANPFDLNGSPSERLSFSFLMDENIKFEKTNNTDTNDNYHNLKVDQSVLNNRNLLFTRATRSSKLCDSFKTFNSKCENMAHFKPIFVSTPKRSKIFSISRNISTKECFVELNKSRIKDRTIKRIPKKNASQEKQNIKHKSMSSRLFEAINESCITIIRSVKNAFGKSKSSITTRKDSQHINNIENEQQEPNCSYSFTNYMRKREAEMRENKRKYISSEVSTLNTVNVCNTCDDTLLLQHKFANDEHLKSTIRKLKLGINLFGCDFQRISKTMWPRETYMTPNVLYSLYRKLLLK